MNRRALLRQVLRSQHEMATSLGRLVTESAEHTQRLAELHHHLDHMARQIAEQGESIMTRNEDQAAELRAGLAQLSVDLGELATRIEAKIDAAGSPDVDLSAELSTLRDFSTQVDALVAEPAPEPEPTPEA